MNLKKKGKEFNFDGLLIFEGEYLNRKRNGKGKEYEEGKLIFEGEYLDSKRMKGNVYDKFGKIINKLNNENNKIIKEYNKYGKLIFEGEYLKRKRNGKGKEYYWNGKLKFEGEYLNGKQWQGKGYDENNNIAYDIKEGKGLIKEYDLYDRL